MLYDTGGESFTGRPVIERGFVRWLRQSGISTIDQLIVSHADSDHAGGLAEITQYFDIKSHFGFGESPAYREKKSRWDGTFTFSFIWDGKRLDGSNDDSCVVVLTIFESHILLPGDISRTVELDLLAFKQTPVPVALLIAAHHGSSTSSGAHFMSRRPVWFLPQSLAINLDILTPRSAIGLDKGVQVWDTGIQAGIDFEFLPNTACQ